MGRSPPVFKSFWSTLIIGTQRYRSAQNGTTQGSSEIELYLSVPLSDTRSGTIVAQSRHNCGTAEGGSVPFAHPLLQLLEPVRDHQEAFGARRAMPAVLGDAVTRDLAERGHRVEVLPLQQPYRQAASGAGAVKMVMIDPETGVMYGGVSPANSDYVLGR